MASVGEGAQSGLESVLRISELECALVDARASAGRIVAHRNARAAARRGPGERGLGSRLTPAATGFLGSEWLNGRWARAADRRAVLARFHALTGDDARGRFERYVLAYCAFRLGCARFAASQSDAEEQARWQGASGRLPRSAVSRAPENWPSFWRAIGRARQHRRMAPEK